MENYGGGQRNSLIHGKMGKMYNALFSSLAKTTRLKCHLALISEEGYITLYNIILHSYHWLVKIETIDEARTAALPLFF